MLMKTFTMRFDPRIEGFDDEPVREFCKDKETLSIRDHFFVKDDAPYWAVMLTYNCPPRSGSMPGEEPRKKSDGDATGYRAILREEDWPIFNAMRDWRAERAKREGVPPYLVLTNEVLARVIRTRPSTLNALGQIHGVGAAKVKRYGDDILRGVRSHPPAEPGPAHSEGSDPSAPTAAEATVPAEATNEG